ncbi:MAG: ribose-5-phosphate isomerase RpiA [Alphaproteobacteria bacterium]|nr:ribose-5-phosphate isomerase RpiA [Alphaproteobacteria bacterium]
MTADDQKRAAAIKALDHILPGMRLGLGTGSTAAHFVRALGQRVREGLAVTAVATSEATAALAREFGITIVELNELRHLDLTVDGADELDGSLRLIKGGGGALLREKIVAVSSDRMIVIADESKLVGELGNFPLPVEIVPFGYRVTMERIADAAAAAGCAQNLITLRGGEKHPFRTDGGNFIADCDCSHIPHPEDLDTRLSFIPGVVENGLFLDLATVAIIGHTGGVKELPA